jgi:hypothetical protein
MRNGSRVGPPARGPHEFAPPPGFHETGAGGGQDPYIARTRPTTPPGNAAPTPTPSPHEPNSDTPTLLLRAEHGGTPPDDHAAADLLAALACELPNCLAASDHTVWHCQLLTQAAGTPL